MKRGISDKWLVLWSLWAARLVPQHTPELRLHSGLVRGMVAPDGTFVRYTNIPYATVVQRFQAPEPVPTWDGIFNAVDEHVRCQQSVGDYVMTGQRDCLVLNVYTPVNTHPDERLPVMVFIHGGGFFQGSASPTMYGPKYFIRKGVILVTLNYRLNIQGFLCLRIKEAPGNAAMKDINSALKWVQKNIKVFGGDPDNVTLFGESAGAASVSFQVLSPMSKGLFYKAITQSGSSLAPWAYQYKPIYLASLLAKTMLHNTEDAKEIAQIFESKSDEELILTRVPREEGNIIPSEILYTPCTEVPIDGVEPFLTKSPIDILSNGTYNKLPMIIGTNSEEGMFLLGIDNETMVKKVKFERALPKTLNITSEELRLQIAERLKRFYMGEDADMCDEVKLSKLYGEPILAYPSLEETEWVSKTNDFPVYSYIFNYTGWRNMPKQVTRNHEHFPDTATHADELFYMFSQPWLASMYEDEFIDIMTTLWTNFAKYGDPTPEPTESLPVRWLPVDPSSPASFVIDKQFSTAPLYYTESLKYLRDIYSKYRRR